jgi:hypothetical protein
MKLMKLYLMFCYKLAGHVIEPLRDRSIGTEIIIERWRRIVLQSNNR